MLRRLLRLLLLLQFGRRAQQATLSLLFSSVGVENTVLTLILRRGFPQFESVGCFGGDGPGRPAIWPSRVRVAENNVFASAG